MSSLRPELHVAQQIRRDKLRIHNGSSQLQHLHEFPNNLEQLSLHPGFDLDLLQVRNNVRNGNMLDDQAALYSSEMIALERHQELGAAAEQPIHGHYGSVPHSSSTIHSSRKQQCGNWRNSSSTHQSCDWMVNHASTSVANQSNILPFELNNNNNNVPTDVQSSSPSLYQNALQDIFKSASISGHGSEMSSLMHQAGHGLWGGINASEPVLNHPSYGNQANLWTDRTVVDNALRWNSFTDKKINEQDTGHVLSDSNPQGLSLSLSSNSHSNPSASQFDDPQSRTGTSKDPPQYSKDVKSLQDPNMGIPSNSTTTYRNVGPLGPFTGYATILKSSRFLKPCQQLLDEYCSQSRELGASTSADAVNVDENGVATKRSNSGVSSSTMFYNSNENSADGGASNSFSSRPECQKNKAKLLYMEEEVTRRCKQYQQQMQMVVSSFETVAGLSSATPYISLALKSVSRHFRCLKNAISDQLKLVCEVLGEDLSIPTTSTTSSKLDTNMTRLRCINQSFQKNKSGGGNMDFLEPQQHVWRPQRGLPERAVTILKAWLFEHFLHPYPTDTDKHMLATQTGLSRNQVSNWFINARVRVWKPMVEEIHMLETKGTTTGANHNSSKNEGTCCASEGSSSQPRVDEPLSNFEEKGLDEEQWNQEKRSKYECEITSSMDGTLMGFMPYRHGGGLEVGGLGSVSLTLGLRHGVEGVQHQQQQQQQQQQQLEQEQQQLRHHFGGHMIHDFVG